jgi:hypothetical protein
MRGPAREPIVGYLEAEVRIVVPEPLTPGDAIDPRTVYAEVVVYPSYTSAIAAVATVRREGPPSLWVARQGDVRGVTDFLEDIRYRLPAWDHETPEPGSIGSGQ